MLQAHAEIRKNSLHFHWGIGGDFTTPAQPILVCSKCAEMVGPQIPYDSYHIGNKTAACGSCLPLFLSCLLFNLCRSL